MKNKNVCDFSDILFFAETLGYDWNQAHDILDDYYPQYGAMNVYKSEITEEECPNEDARKILLGYFEEEDVTEFQINPKGG